MTSASQSPSVEPLSKASNLRLPRVGVPVRYEVTGAPGIGSASARLVTRLPLPPVTITGHRVSGQLNTGINIPNVNDAEDLTQKGFASESWT